MPCTEPLSRLLRDRSRVVLSRWELVRRESAALRELESETLCNGLPALLDAIADASDPANPRREDAAERAREVAAAHARHRLERGFGLDEVCREYALLRRLLLESLSDACVTISAIAVLDQAIDEAVAAAVTTYVDSSARALRDREALLGAVLEQLPLGAVVVDVRGDAPLTNARARDLVAAESDRVGALVAGALEAHRLDGAELRPEEWPLRRSLDRGEEVAGEELEVAMHGRKRTIRVSSAAVRDGEGCIRAGVALLEDVTDQRRAEAERARLFRERERTRNLLGASLAQMPAGVIVVDLTGEVLYANARLEELFGFRVRTGESVTSYTDRYRGFYPSGRRLQADDWPILRTLRRGETVNGELIELEREDGSRALIRISSTPVLDDRGRAFAALALMRDVTAQEHAERDRARLAAIVESGNDLVAITTAEGRITYLNEAGRRMLGLAPGADPGALTLTDFATPAVREAVRDAVRRQRRWTGEIELRNPALGPDAPTIPVLCYVFTFEGEGGRRDPGIAVIAHDVSEERRRSEFERQLMGIAGHDLKNPLHAILLSSDLLLRRALGPEERALVERIRSASQRSVRLVHEVLDFTQARLGGGLPLRVAEVDLGAVTAQVIEELRTAHPERTVVAEQNGDLRGVWDGERLAQVVSNLATNAIKHGARDRPIGVRVRGLDDEVVIEVRNEGPAIPEDVRARLFEPLRHGGGRSAGLGLGLFIVRHVVERHGGTVTVRSTDGETVFEVRLPRDARSTHPMPRESHAS